MKVRFISKETGRQIKSAAIAESYVTSKRTALMEVCDEYTDNGLFMFNGLCYTLSEIVVTVKPLTDLTDGEKIMLLTQDGIYKSAAERAVKKDIVIFYPDTNDGMKDYFDSRSDLCSPKDKKHEWNRLDKVNYFDEYCNFLGAYRYDYFV